MGRIASRVLLMTCFITVVILGSSVGAVDNDGNGIEDQDEQELAELMCPSLVLDSRDLAIDVPVFPEPVEIVANRMYSMIYSIALSWGGHKYMPYETYFPDGDYSWLSSQEYGQLLEGSCAGFDREYLYFHFDFGGYGPGCTPRESGGTYDQPAGWGSIYRDGNSYTHKASEFPHTVYAHLFRYYHVPESGYTEYAVQYWFFYPYNDWVADHEGDWEHIDVHFVGNTPASAQIVRVVYYFHHRYKRCEHVQGEHSGTDFDCYVLDDTHPVVFVGGWGQKSVTGGTGSGPGSHGCYPVYGHWDKVVDKSVLGMGVFSVDEHVDGNGAFLHWSQFVDSDPNGRYGVVVIKNPNQYDFDGDDAHMSWIKAQIHFGHPFVHSLGSENFIGPVYGNEAPVGPHYQETWEESGHDTELFRNYLGSCNEFPRASDAQWELPSPLVVSSPVQNAEVSDIVLILGSLFYGDSVTIDVGDGANPVTWTRTGVQASGAMPVYQSQIGTWNTGTVPAGIYTLRVRVFRGAQMFEEIRTVTVAHRSAVVDPHGGGDFLSIQTAIDWAEMGDTVRVSGTSDCVENLTMKQTVYLVAPSSNVRIVGVGDNPVVTISDHDYPCYLDGFTIMHQNGEANDNGRGIEINNASPLITNCKIIDNKADRAAGIRITGGESRPIVKDCEIRDNNAWASDAGGVLIDAGQGPKVPTATFVNCRIVGNYSHDGAAVVAWYADADTLESYQAPTFLKCAFDSNTVEPSITSVGHIVLLRDCDNVVFEDCTFNDNLLEYFPPGSGALGGSNYTAILRNCTIANNRRVTVHPFTAPFAGIDYDDAYPTSPVTVQNCIIAFNDGPAVGQLANATMEQTDVYGNEPTSGAFTDLEWTSVGVNVINEDPAFCDAENGDYSLFAFSPCVAGVYFDETIGAEEVGCIPEANVTVLTDSLYGAEHVLTACPKGDAFGYHVTLTF